MCSSLLVEKKNLLLLIFLIFVAKWDLVKATHRLLKLKLLLDLRLVLYPSNPSNAPSTSPTLHCMTKVMQSLLPTLQALDEDELGSYAVVDPYENVTTPRKNQLLQEDEAKIEKEKERLTKAFMNGDQPNQVLKSSQLKFHKELDLISEHAKAKGKKTELNCYKCKVKLADLEMYFIHQSGPQLKATLVQPAKQKVVTRQLGPQCHVKVKSTRGHRCYEGYWVNGKLFKDPDGTEEVEVEDLWKCAKAYLENKIAELSQVCNCGPKKKPSSMTMLSSHVTFGHGPRFRTDVCVPIDEDFPVM